KKLLDQAKKSKFISLACQMEKISFFKLHKTPFPSHLFPLLLTLSPPSATRKKKNGERKGNKKAKEGCQVASQLPLSSLPPIRPQIRRPAFPEPPRRSGTRPCRIAAPPRDSRDRILPHPVAKLAPQR
uniref:Uncharacterized protein n=1 Tax=Aegilops tauschii subsp. strangulata TaxID=200361 RepID=A0A452Y0S0_AEGTS